MTAELEPAVDGAARARAVAEARRLITEERLSANEASARVAEPLGVTGRSVKRWAAQDGQPLGALSRDALKTRAATQALQARAGYTAARRLVVADKLLAAIEGQINYVEPADLGRLTMAFAIASDKRSQLEDRAAEQAALADPAYWGWLAARPGADPLMEQLRPAPFTAGPEAVTPARYHLAADALARLNGEPGPARPPRAFSPRPGTRRPKPPVSGVDAELAALRDGALPASRRMRAAAALADAGWGPAPDGDPDGEEEE